MHHTPIHVIDFEGTRSSGIVEYGVVTVVGAVIESTATRICAPEGSISDVDQRQHGISEASAAEQQSFTNEWERFAALRQSGPLCAHNAAVEDGLLCSVWSCPRESPNFANTDAPVATWGPWLDTLYLYRRIYIISCIEIIWYTLFQKLFKIIFTVPNNSSIGCIPNGK